MSNTRQHESTGKNSRMGLDAQSPFERLLMQSKLQSRSVRQLRLAMRLCGVTLGIHFWCAFSTFKLQPGTSHASHACFLSTTLNQRLPARNRQDKMNGQNEDCSFYSMIFCPRVFKTWACLELSDFLKANAPTQSSADTFLKKMSKLSRVHSQRAK